MRVAAIIPAYNEERRIGAVIEVLRQTKGLSEIIVVDDGSTDGTLRRLPQNDGVRAVHLVRNQGKAAALLAGARESSAEVLLFLDADLIGLACEHVESLLEPLLEEKADMTVAVFRGGRWHTDISQKLAPGISGQRALRRDFLLSLHGLDATRFGIETALTRQAKLHGLRVKKVPWKGVTHVLKEEKLGLVRGLWARMRMYWEIGAYMYFADGHNGVTEVSPAKDASSGKEEGRQLEEATED